MPIIWEDLKNHYIECYFCLTNYITDKMTCTNLIFTQMSVPNSKDVPVYMSRDLFDPLDTGIGTFEDEE